MKHRTACPICGSKADSEAFTAYDFDTAEEPFQIFSCDDCGMADTRPRLNPEEIGQYYKKDYYGDGAQKFGGPIELLTRWANILLAKKIVGFFPKTAGEGRPLKVLDIGCGRATLLRSLRDMGHDCHGIERDEFPEHADISGLSIYREELKELHVPENSFDVVVIWHVLEHLHEPFETLDEVTRALRPGGLLVIAVPNFASFQARFFRSRWFHLDLPRHLYHFGISNLCRSLIDRGYAIKDRSTCSLEQNIYGFIQSSLNYLGILGKPNQLYRILKKQSSRPSLLRYMLWAGLSALLLLFALIEYVVSCMLGTGASAIVFAENKTSK